MTLTTEPRFWPASTGWRSQQYSYTLTATFDRSSTTQATNHSISALDLSDDQIEQWVIAVLPLAEVTLIEDYFVAEVPGIPEAWMDGPTPEAALAGLPDVLFDWARLTVDEGQSLPLL